MIRFAPASEPVEAEPVSAPLAAIKPVERPPVLELSEPVAAPRRQVAKPRASKKKPAPPAEGAPQLALDP
jgi:hypothetical protein